MGDIAHGDSSSSAEPSRAKRLLVLEPVHLRDVVQAHLQCSSSWSRLPAADAAAPKRLAKVASEPAIAKKGPAKPAVPVREILPFQAASGTMPRPEAWAPLLGERARRAELQMQQRLR